MSQNQMVAFQEPSDGATLAPEFMPVVQAGLTDDLSQGVGGGFAVVSIRAGRFRVKHKGNEIPIMNEKNEPVGSIDVVLVRANAAITKQFFTKPYEEGDAFAPDCFSTDGITPSPQSPLRQAATCAVCPKNIFGSAPPRNGVQSKAKACQDNRKLAIVPLDDMDNETFGGPMLFRVPPSALNDLAQFGAAWKARGYPYNAIGVRIGMDINASFPKPTFTAIRPLRSDEAQKVLAIMNTPAVEKILNDYGSGEPAAAAAQAGTEFIEAPEEAAAPTPAPAPAPVQTSHPVQTPVQGTTFGKKPAPAPTAAPAPAAPAGAGATFGKAKVTPAPVAAAPAAAAPAAPAAAPKRTRAPKAPAAAPAPAPVAAESTPAPESVAEDPSANADADIESILAELGQVAGN